MNNGCIEEASRIFTEHLRLVGLSWRVCPFKLLRPARSYMHKNPTNNWPRTTSNLEKLRETTMRGSVRRIERDDCCAVTLPLNKPVIQKTQDALSKRICCARALGSYYPSKAHPQQVTHSARLSVVPVPLYTRDKLQHEHCTAAAHKRIVAK